jgi:mono-ADP-ribosyltransferase sirtuin 6
MSTSYAAKLIQNVDKGLCGDPEYFDSMVDVETKVLELYQLMAKSSYTVIHTGAGISTSAGIPDFRGPNGVWTRQNMGLPIEDPLSVGFEEARPTFSHRAIVELFKNGFVQHIVTQNVDGLHIKSGLPRDKVSEVHGTAFAEYCVKCQKEYRTEKEVPTIGLKPTGSKCPDCGKSLIDRLCDWDSPLPEDEVDTAIQNHRIADLVICLGTSLRIRPAGLWPTRTLRKNGKTREGDIVIVNLQKTHLDSKCAVRIFHRIDLVFELLMKQFGLQVPDAI